jgi:hypothetical protein
MLVFLHFLLQIIKVEIKLYAFMVMALVVFNIFYNTGTMYLYVLGITNRSR